jgi:Fe-S cluster assembly protein SufD
MKQYLDFFLAHRATIDRDCPPLLNTFRDKAFETFRRTGFPAAPTGNDRHTDVGTLLKDDFGFSLNRPEMNSHHRRMFRCGITNLNAHTHFIVNGHFADADNRQDFPPAVFSGSLNHFAEKRPALFLKYYNRIAGPADDGLSAFNTAFVQDGYVLFVPENTVIEKPVQLTNITAGNMHSLINRRILIILEAGAQAQTLVCDHSYGERRTTANTQTVEIFTGENAALDFCELEESNPNTVRLSNCFVRQATASRTRINTVTLSAGITRNNYIVDMAGERAETNLAGMAIADSRQKINNRTLVNHHIPNCRCTELFKYLLDDEAVGIFNGRIVVAHGAQNTETCQTNHSLLGSRGCRMFSEPQLEIYADDVKCSHGMTTGQIDENALFYLCSRGIPKEEAALLLKFAFTADVIRNIRMEGLRERLRLLIEKRLRGEPVSCRECEIP